MTDRLRAHIARGFELGTTQEKQLANFRKAIGLGGIRQQIKPREREWHAQAIQNAEAQMHLEQIVGHDASHTASKRSSD